MPQMEEKCEHTKRRVRWTVDMIASPLALTTVLYFLLSMTGCYTESMNTVEQVTFVNLDKGFTSGLHERKFLVIQTADEWKELWSSHLSGSTPQKALPPVDFKTEMVVAAFLGEKMTGGYTINITKIEENRPKSTLIVTIRVGEPPADAIVTQVLTQPFHIVKLKKVNLPATFMFE